MLELLAQTTQPDPNWYEALDRVRAFYTDAFYAVVAVTVAVVGLFGFMTAAVVAWLQKRSFAREQERLLQGARQKMNFDVGRTCEWLGASTFEDQGGFAAMMFLHAARYFAEAADGALAAQAVQSAQQTLKHIRSRWDTEDIDIPNAMFGAIEELKATVKSLCLHESFKDLIPPVEEIVRELIERDKNAGADAVPPGAQDDE